MPIMQLNLKQHPQVLVLVLASVSASGSCMTSNIASSSMSSASDIHDPWKSAVEEFQHSKYMVAHLFPKDTGPPQFYIHHYLYVILSHTFELL